MADKTDAEKKSDLAQKLADDFEQSVMESRERKLAEDKKIRIIPETLEACVLPNFKMKILPHAHTKKITDQLVKISAEYEKEHPSESARYAAEEVSSRAVFKLVLLNPEGKPFSDADFTKAANDESIGLGALNKLTKKLYVFLVVEGGKAGLGY